MKYILYILLFLPLSEVYSQDHPSFKRISAIDGLSNDWVRTIYMDDFGYMWFGTADGLNKYNGHQFKLYRPRTTNGKQIGNINVSDILKKSDFELWVCTDLGLYVYNYRKDELQPSSQFHSLATQCIFQDKQQSIWMGSSQGVYCFEPETKTSTHYLSNPADPLTLSNNYINTIFEDSHNNIWIGTKEGLNLFVRESKTFRRFRPNISAGIATNDILSITEDRNNRLWVSDSKDGLYVVDLSLPTVEFKKIASGQIIKILIDHNNNLWIGKAASEGLDIIDLNHFSMDTKPAIVHLQNNQMDIHSLSDNSIFSIYEDRFNDIWVGTFGSGINYYSTRSKKFNIVNQNPSKSLSISNNLVNAFTEDENSTYIGTEGGLDIIDKKTGKTIHFGNEPDNPNSLGSNAIYTLHKDRRNNIWIGTWTGGLNLFHPKTGKFKRFLPDDRIFAIFEDKSGSLWIGTVVGGLKRYDYKSGIFTTYKNDPQVPGSIYGDIINHIYQARNGRLYISAENSLDIYDYNKDTFTHVVHDVTDTSANYGNILSVYEDSKNNIWITTNAGLELFNENEKTFTTAIFSNLMPDNTIQGILEDDHGNLWISTNKGLIKFVNGINHPDEPVIFNYTFEDGLSANEFKKRSAFKDSQGIMYFGSSNGFTYFHPDSIKIDRMPPKIILSDFSMGNHENETYKNLSNINFIDGVELPFRNADFEIQFAALNYLNPQNNHFKYKLEGYDDAWIDADKSLSARYTNLNHGEYTFMILASNNDGIWSEAPRTLKIVIHPPWWKTIAFKIFIALFALMLLRLSYSFRFKMLERQKRALEKSVQDRTRELININQIMEQKQEEITVQFEELSKYKNHLESIVDERTADLRSAKDKAEESDKLKTAFLQNMSHEIRTPLNAIMGFSELLDESFEDKETLVNYATIIKQKGSDLLDIINGILDISKIESGSLGIILENCRIEDLFKEIETFFHEYQQRLNKGHILFILNNQTKLNDEITLDIGKVKQVIINLVNNAFKFTPQGKIEFGCRLRGSNHLEFYVSDTGCGIPPDKQDLIFERFRQINELHYREGAGLGLSISKGLIELLGGEIWLTSELEKGTTFYFTVPFFIEPLGK